MEVESTSWYPEYLISKTVRGWWSQPLQMWGEAAQRKPTFAAHCCVGRRAQWTASSHSIFLLAGCPETLRCSICFVILQGPSRGRWQPRIQELVCFGGVGDQQMPRRLIYPARERYGGPRPEGWSLFWEVRPAACCCSPHTKKTMPFCYRSRLLLLLCLLTFSAWDFLGEFPHLRSKCHKYQNSSEGERNPKRTTDFITSILAKKLERKTSAFYFILSPVLLLQKSIGGETERKKKCNHLCLFHPKKPKTFLGLGERKRWCP